ncbi:MULTISPECIES: aconitase X [Enorma]|uniref:aconitase X n=1 Tax=Enorma TaxID=1472762 RepID=UPI000346365A|nr:MULTISPECIES: aconitase X [Enorma]
MQHTMQLTAEQEAILEGVHGDTLARVMETLVRYGEIFGATKMVPVTSRYNHLVTSFGLKALTPVYDLMDQLIRAGAVSKQQFSADPRPLDPAVPSNLLQNLVFKKFMYSKQDFYEGQLQKLGLMQKDAFTCTCYMDEVGNTPALGEVLSWSESSAVVYANSVLGARCNRNSGIIDLMGSVVGFVPYFGLLTDDGRRADWVVEIRTTKKPEAQLLGSAIGMKVMEDVPYIVGLDRWLGELDDDARDYLKDFGAATASNGAVGLYHVEGITPEAVRDGRSLVREGAQTYVIDDAELQRVYDGYPIVWKKRDAAPKLCFMGCPHMSLNQLKAWTDKIEAGLAASGRERVAVPTVFTAAPAVVERFNETPYAARLAATGVIVSYICPLMYMNNPLCGSMPVITSSNKLRTYTTARYYTDDEILEQITGCADGASVAASVAKRDGSESDAKGGDR